MESTSHDPLHSSGGVSSKTDTTAASVIASAILTVLKLIVGILTNSLGLIAEAAHSFLDLCSTLITFWVVRVADKPPDSNHPYGHEKAEHLGALAGMSLLATTACFILYQAFGKIFIQPEAPHVSIWSFAVLLVTLVVDFLRSRSLKSAAEAHSSQALAADAEHFSNDMFGSLAVMLGLGIVAFSHVMAIPSWLVTRADAFAAVMVAFIALYSVFTLGASAVRALMDDVPIDLVNRLRTQVEEVDGVVPGTVVLRSRYVGKRPYVEVKLGMSRSGSLEEAHQLSEKVEAALATELGSAEATVHVEPVAPPNESHAATVRAIALRLGFSIHNLSIYQLHHELCVELDLEVSNLLTVAEAHLRSDILERALLKELPQGSSIHVHLEPRSDEVISAVKHTDSWERIQKALEKLPEYGDVAIRDVLLTDQGIVVNLDRVFSGETTLSEAHDHMAILEQELRQRIPDLVRVHINPEVSTDR
ncbi:MAG: cation diffusion facilitator family transporter [Verrucomicrobiota bacterium]